MTGREIITLQLGHYANFIGAHWWNIQESSFVYDPKILQTFPKEVNHDVLFREGLTQKGQVTFTPRLVALDLRGSLNTLKKGGSLYGEASDEEVKWSGDVTLHQSPSAGKNEFLHDLEKAEENEQAEWKKEGGQDDCRDTEDIGEARKTDEAMELVEEDVFGQKFYQLDGQVKVWSDYLSVHLHPQSVQILQDYFLDSDDQPFDVFGVGQQALKGDTWDELEERLRFFIEECDLLQGFHVLFDTHNSFGGTAVTAMEYLRDEFPGKAVLTVPVAPAVLPDQTAKQRATRIINSALCVSHCVPQSSLYLPLSLAESLWRNLGDPRDFSLLSYQPELNYHTSAILSAALDTMSMPYRQEANPVHLWDITTSFSYLGRKVAALSSSLPMPLLEAETFVDTLMSHDPGALFQSLTPSVSYQSQPNCLSCVVRGVPQNRVKRDKGGSSPRLLSSCDTVQDVLQLYLQETYPGSVRAGCVMRDPLKVVSPFPHIFKPPVTRDGLVSTTQTPKSTYGVESVPVMTSLQSGSEVGQYVSSLHAEAARFTIRKHHHFLEAGLEEEDYEETLNTMQQLADCYNIV